MVSYATHPKAIDYAEGRAGPESARGKGGAARRARLLMRICVADAGGAISLATTLSTWVCSPLAHHGAESTWLMQWVSWPSRLVYGRS